MSKKRTIKTCAITCATAFLLAACGPKAAAGPNTVPATAETTEPMEYTEMVLTKEQMLADYNDMWDTLKESYPFWGVLSRQHPDDPHYYEAILEDYRRQIEELGVDGHDAMWRFIEIISGSLYDVCGATGHMGILNPHYFRDFRSVNEKYLDEIPALQPWVDIGRKQEVNEFYEYYDYLLERLLKTQVEMETGGEEEASTETTAQAEPNLTMEILSEENKVAYIKVDSFEDSMMEEDLPAIRNFLYEVADYSHLIIDTRNNRGGNAAYWEEAFVRPNISEPAVYSTIRLMADNDLTRTFYGAEYQDSNITIEEIKKDDKLSGLQREDLSGLVFARAIVDTIEPEFDEKLFKGKIWLLTSPDMFSSAESFAVFCKVTGFATLAGQATGGSNSGGAVWYELPESHLLVTFDVEYCLNPDGSCNMENGTVPDIVSDDALGTVLGLID